MRTVRIFISSPGDVQEERDRARQVVESLRRRYAVQFELNPVLWEELPLQADMAFQQGIDLVLSREQGIDVGVFILWSRLGSTLGVLIRKDDGSEYRSGTEREFDLMLKARQQSGGSRPALLIYTRQDESSFDERLRGRPTAEKAELIAQKRRVEQFISEEFNDQDSGYNVRAYHSFDRPVTFSQRLRAHLTELLDELAGKGAGEAVWDLERQGPPFLGLAAFQPEHRDVFFGREAETLEARHALGAQARNGCAFLLLSGASGSGKSSLARAGVLPAITENELDEQVSFWQTVIATPIELGPDPAAGLVERLAAVVPELRGEIDGLEELTAGLRSAPALTVRLRVRDALARTSKRRGGGVRVLLVIDQLEELFASAAVTDAGRTEFLGALEALARSGQVWVLATVRSDFSAQVQAQPALARMLEGGGLMPVLPPDTDALRRLIEEPARLAGVSFAQRDGQSLAGRILDDATAHAELLPLLEYLLRELFEQRAGEGELTWEAYAALGGVEGALAKRAEAVFTALPEEAQKALGTVLKSLVTVGQKGRAEVDGVERLEPFVRQRASLRSLSMDAAAATLVQALVVERLLTASNDPASGEAVVSVAHESLLRVWPRAAAWAEGNRDFLRTRARIATRMGEGSPLLDGDPLLEAAKADLRRDPLGFSEAQRSFIEESVRRAANVKRKREWLRNGAAVTLGMLAVVAVIGWYEAVSGKKRAEAEKVQAQAGELVAAAENNFIERPDQALLLAFAARRLSANPKADALIRVAGASYGYRTVLRGHADRVYHAQFSPDGTTVLTASEDKTARLWDAASGKELQVFRGHANLVYGAQFSADGKTVLTTSSENIARLWDLASGKELQVLRGHADVVVSAQFSADGKTVMTASRDQTVRLWDAATGRELQVLRGHVGPVLSARLAADGKTILTGSEDHTARLWDAASGKEVKVFRGHERPVRHVQFSADRKTVLTASDDQTARLWDAASGKQLHLLDDHVGWVGADFSADGKTVLTTATEDPTARLWDVPSGKQLQKLRGHAGRILSAHFSADSKTVLTVSLDKTARLWDAASGKQLHVLRGHDGRVNHAEFSADGKTVLTASDDQTARLWDMVTGNQRVLRGHEDKVWRAQFSADGKTALTAGFDETAQLWDVSSGERLQILRGHGGRVSSAQLSADGKTALTASNDKSARLWDAATGTELRALRGHADLVVSAQFSADGKTVLTASLDQTARLWDAANGKELQVLHGHAGQVLSAEFSSDSKMVLTASEDQTARLWDAASGKELRVLRGHTDRVMSAGFSRDGKTMITASDDKTARLWDTASGKELRVLRGHAYRVYSAQFSADGKTVLTASADQTARLWDAVSGNELQVLRGHEGQVSSAQFSADGRTVLTASADHSARLWDTVSGKELQVLRGHEGIVLRAQFSSDNKTVLTASTDGTARLWDCSVCRPIEEVAAELTKAVGRDLTDVEIRRYGVPEAALARKSR